MRDSWTKSIFINCKNSDEAFKLIQLTGSNPAYINVWNQCKGNTVFRIKRDVIEGFDSIRQYRKFNPGIKIISYKEYEKNYSQTHTEDILNTLSQKEKSNLLKHLVSVAELWIEAESDISIHHENHNDLVRRIASALDISENEYADQVRSAPEQDEELMELG